jgi:pyruvate/2-oxoglutarate dehydrogenase complex dihydrolipoamide acyltransferase (E2) component
MKNQQGYRIVPFSINRQMVAASTSVGREQSNIHTITEVDIARPRQLMHEIRERTSRSPSLTAYITTCLARAVSEFPNFNAFRKGRNLVILDDVTISVLVEREINGEIIPENLGIKAAQTKTYWQIHEEIRGAQNHAGGGLGGLEGITWLRFIPGILFRTFVKIAAKNIGGGATVGVAVGGIVERPSIVDRHLESRDYLCLTITFNHDIVDGAPAARFVKRFSELLMSGELLENEKHLISTESEILAQET